MREGQNLSKANRVPLIPKAEHQNSHILNIYGLSDILKIKRPCWTKSVRTYLIQVLEDGVASRWCWRVLASAVLELVELRLGRIGRDVA